MLFFCAKLAGENFDMLINSPLKRASQTADIIWGERNEPRKDLASLREIDLYSFQVPNMNMNKLTVFLDFGPCHLHPLSLMLGFAKRRRQREIW